MEHCPECKGQFITLYRSGVCRRCYDFDPDPSHIKELEENLTRARELLADFIIMTRSGTEGALKKVMEDAEKYLKEE